MPEFLYHVVHSPPVVSFRLTPHDHESTVQTKGVQPRGHGRTMKGTRRKTRGYRRANIPAILPAACPPVNVGLPICVVDHCTGPGLFVFSVVLIGYASDAVLVPNRGVGELDLNAAWVAAVVVRGEGCKD